MILRFKPANSGLNFSGKIIIEKTEKYKSTGRYEDVFKLRRCEYEIEMLLMNGKKS